MRNKFFLIFLFTVLLFIFGIYFLYKNTIIIFPNFDRKTTIENVKDYGALGNGVKDDTLSIQKVIDRVSKNGGGIVEIPRGRYAIDATKSITLKNNITLKFDPGTELFAIPNSSENYSVINIHDVENVSLIGEMTIIGEREHHKGERGEWGFGISIRGSNNIYIEKPRIKDFWGDGIYIGSTAKQNYSKHITILNPICENNRRQGITIISAIDLDIINPQIFSTKGIPPEYGIDLEPNNKEEFLKEINIIAPTTKYNEGGGIRIYLDALSQSKNPINIRVIDKTEITDGFEVKGKSNVKGKIMVDSYYLLNN